jgi:chorismate mutase/prephenate dehydratase
MSDPDPTLADLRDRIAAVDRAILAAVNERLELVGQIQAHKREHGLAALDPERERWLLAHLEQANAGPLSSEGLRELHAAILELTKRELGHGG